tara:strand:- start:278 stop:853 length:576 start_codon:yes stop_codon:yes gene_type:complete
MDTSSSSLALYEKDFIAQLQQMNLDMCDFAESDLMTDHAYNELSMLQKKQLEQIKMMFRHIQTILGSRYFKERCEIHDTPLRKKRMSEKAKREDCILYPDKYSICPCCDSIFMNPWNLARHRKKTLKCSVIKCSKKGALEFSTHRAPDSISAYINDHLDDPDSDNEVESAIQDDIQNEEPDPHADLIDQHS